MDRHNCTDTMSAATLSSALPLTWHGWLEDGKALIVSDVQALWAVLKLWRARQHARRQLQDMDDRLLNDIGMTRKQVVAEARKPFWRA